MGIEYEIQMEDLAHNIFVVQKRAAVPVWGVIKLDGYGTGLLFMAEMLEKCGVRRFAISEAEDLTRLRRAGFATQEILLLSPPATDLEMDQILRGNGIFSLGSVELARRIQSAALRTGCRARAHIKLDTGMGRFGFLPEEYPVIRDLYRSREGLSIEGIYSHFSCASSDKAFTHLQYRRFLDVLDSLAADGIPRGMAHICNSSALFLYPEMRLDAVRAGSALLGRVAGISGAESGLRRVGALAVPVAAVKRLPRGYHGGYGPGALRRDTQAAILAAGRWDGIPAFGWRERLFKNRRPAAELNGQRLPFLHSPGEGSTVLDAGGLDLHPGDIAHLDISPLRLNPSVKKCYC